MAKRSGLIWLRSVWLAVGVCITCEPVFAISPNTFAGVQANRLIAAHIPHGRDVLDLGPAPRTQPVSIALNLAYQHADELERLIELQSDPRSQYYHRYLSHAQFDAYFAPRAVDEQHVVDLLGRAGFVITKRSSNRTVVDAVAPASIIERYFSTELHRFVQAGAGVRYANVLAALLPAELSGTVESVVGFSSVVRMRPDLAVATPAQRSRAKQRALMLADGNGARLVGSPIIGWHAPSKTSGGALLDGGFESGRLGTWQPATTLPAAIIESYHAHSGTFSAFTGSQTYAGGEVNGDAGVVEPVTIPANGVLTFWALQGSNETSPNAAWQEADLLDNAGRRIVNFYATVKSTNGAWTKYSFALGANAGQHVYLYFGIHGNADLHHRTFQFIDDVQLSAGASPPTGTPIGGPLTGPDGGYGPVIVANDYDLPVQHRYDGAGRATGIAISGDFSDADLGAYLYEFGITRRGATTRIAVDGGAHYDPTTLDTQEATLDVETIAGLAPSTHVYMYLIPDLGDVSVLDGYNRAVSDNLVDVINSSFGGCEIGDQGFNLALNRVAQQGAAEGITFSASSGDQGSQACTTTQFGFTTSVLGINTPASVPNFVAVGGTSLYTNDDGSYASESGWSGSTGGISVVWPLPAYQTNVRNVTRSARNVPDIAFPADPNTGSSYFVGGQWQGPIGGTSWSSPIFCALVTEMAQHDNTRFGYINPFIYNLYLGTDEAKYFRDVQSGSNGDYTAGNGYDLVTGLGSLHALE